MRVLFLGKNVELVNEFNNIDIMVDNVLSIEDLEYYLDVRKYETLIVYENLVNLDIIDNIRKKYFDTKIIILSHNTDEDIELDYLYLKVNDYIILPKKVSIIIQKTLNLINIVDNIEIGDLIFKVKEERVYYKNNLLELQGKALEVLKLLMINRGSILSKDQILDSIWEEPEIVTPNVIEVCINQIRQKIDKPYDITTVETIRRRGYRIN